jgi:predicted nucleotide-binding protein (sugar kinase/HSP70/actin superfamily)
VSAKAIKNSVACYLSNPFSAVKEYLKRIAVIGNDHVDTILSKEGKPIQINDLMSWPAFNVMGLITFGESFEFVKAQEQKMELVHE